MSLHRSQWKIQAKQLSELLQSNGKDEGMIREMLDSLNGLVYPVEKVYSEVATAQACCRCLTGFYFPLGYRVSV